MIAQLLETFPVQVLWVVLRGTFYVLSTSTMRKMLIMILNANQTLSKCQGSYIHCFIFALHPLEIDAVIARNNSVETQEMLNNLQRSCS